MADGASWQWWQQATPDGSGWYWAEDGSGWQWWQATSEAAVAAQNQAQQAKEDKEEAMKKNRMENDWPTLGNASDKRGRGRGGGAGGKSKEEEGAAKTWGEAGGPTNEVLEGEWIDSLGHKVIVGQGPRRRAPLTARLIRGDREQALSLRCDPVTGAWACGNAVMEISASGPSCLTWIAVDGRRSVWRRQPPSQQKGPRGGAKLAAAKSEQTQSLDLLPWLLVDPHAEAPAIQREEPKPAKMPMPRKNIGRGRGRRRWASMAFDEAVSDGEDAAEPEEAEEEAEPAEEEKEEQEKDAGPAYGISATDEGPSADAARVSCVLDMRQVLGNDRSAQEELSYLLMDYDLVRQEGDDPIVPPVTSPLWDRLAEVPRRNLLQRLRTGALGAEDFVAEAITDNFHQIRCGRHVIPVAESDVQALYRRYTGPRICTKRGGRMANVLALYRMLENPLLECWQRSAMQLSWDPMEQKRAGIEYELFASPFNARVNNGHFLSRWPHVDRHFGSAGSYPANLDAFPEGAIVGVNPPFSDSYLEHLMGDTLDKLIKRYRVNLTVPVKDAPWRPKLQKFNGVSFVRLFWDSTQRAERPLAQPVVYWDSRASAAAAKGA